MKKKNILVTACGGGAGISAVKSLSICNGAVRVFGTDIDSLAAGQFYCDDFQTMAPFSDREMYERDLKHLVDKWDIDIVLPTLQEELVYIVDILSDINVEVFISPEKTLEICCDKVKFYKWIDDNFPEYSIPWCTSDYISEKFSYFPEQYFIKPRFGRGGSGCQSVTLSQVPRYLNLLSDKILMHHVYGKEYTVDCYIKKNGNTILVVPRERLQVSDGVSLKGRTVKDEEIIGATKKVIKKLDFIGPICVQWKRNNEGKLKILEINPRLSGGSQITRRSGADLMMFFVQEIMYPDSSARKEFMWQETTVIGYVEYKKVC